MNLYIDYSEFELTCWNTVCVTDAKSKKGEDIQLLPTF